MDQILGHFTDVPYQPDIDPPHLFICRLPQRPFQKSALDDTLDQLTYWKWRFTMLDWNNPFESDWDQYTMSLGPASNIVTNAPSTQAEPYFFLVSPDTVRRQLIGAMQTYLQFASAGLKRRLTTTDAIAHIISTTDQLAALSRNQRDILADTFSALTSLRDIDEPPPYVNGWMREADSITMVYDDRSESWRDIARKTFIQWCVDNVPYYDDFINMETLEYYDIDLTKRQAADAEAQQVPEQDQ